MGVVSKIHFWADVMFELTLTTEPAWTTNMQADLNMLVPHQDLVQI
jgi:hypothetical protein